MIIWLGHPRFLVYCVIVCIQLCHIQALGAIHATTGESLVHENLAIHLSLDTQTRGGWLLILLAFLVVCDVTEQSASFLGFFFLMHIDLIRSVLI